jgi:hypothetical protein
MSIEKKIIEHRTLNIEIPMGKKNSEKKYRKI